MCSEEMIGYYMLVSSAMPLLAIWIASAFKHKFTAFIIICMIDFIVVYIYGGNVPCMVLSWGILFCIVGLIYLMFKSVKSVNDNYIEPVQKKHQNNIKKYRKYVINCDKKGKQPLSYKQWKFAYGSKTKHTK